MDADPGLTSFGDGVWLSADPVRILGMRLTATMAIVELDGGRDGRGRELLVYSPVALTPARRTAIATLGDVAHVYAPSLYHHRWVGEWADAFPDATVHGPPGLAAQRPDLRVDREHGSDGLPGGVREHSIAGFRLRESVLLHPSSNTLLVADLVHNVGRPEQAWAKVYTRMMGFHDRVALSRAIRWAGFSDRGAARASLDAILAMPFDRVVVGHGSPIAADGKRALAAPFAWLR